MLSEKKILSTPKIYDYEGDLTKKWFISFKDETGQRRKIQKGINCHKTGKERRNAAQKIINHLLARKKGKLFHRPRKQVLDYLELRKPSWSKKTYSGHKSKMSIFFNWLGHRPVNKDTIRLFFREHLMQLSGCTYNNYKISIKQIMGNALDIDVDYIFKDIEKRRNNSKTAVYFSKQQMILLHNELKRSNEELWFFVQFMYYCFMRPAAEVRFLRVGDIMFDENRILVHGDISKTNKTRYVQIPSAFKPILEEQLSNRDFREFIFYTNDPYKVVSENKFGYRHIKVLRENRFDTNRYKLYGWKNTGMVQALKAGFSLKWIQQQAGHHSLEQTDIYFRGMGISTIEADLTKFPTF